MLNTTKIISLKEKTNRLFKFLLLFYPANYRRRFGEQIYIVMEDMYQEELTRYGKVGLGFWILQFADMGKSIIEEHIDFLGKYGFKKYMNQVLHFNRYNLFGILFLLPFMSVILIDVVSRILQGDLLKPNQFIQHGLYNSPLYWLPILFTWVFIFPILAVLINIIPLVKSVLRNKNRIISSEFFNLNLITLVVILVSFFAIALIFLHDFIPCFIKSLIDLGIFNIGHIILVCNNA